MIHALIGVDDLGPKGGKRRPMRISTPSQLEDDEPHDKLESRSEADEEEDIIGKRRGKTRRQSR